MRLEWEDGSETRVGGVAMSGRCGSEWEVWQ